MSDAPSLRWLSDWSSRWVLRRVNVIGGDVAEGGGVYDKRDAVQMRTEPAPGNLEGTNGVFLKR